MSDNTKIVIESDSKGRINISCEDDNGAGHGYRLAGPKYNLGGGDLPNELVDGLHVVGDEQHGSPTPAHLTHLPQTLFLESDVPHC